MKSLKELLDLVANSFKRAEEASARNAVFLEGFERSVQIDGYSCGAQCAFSILKFYRKARSVDNVTREAGTTSKGTDPEDLRELFLRRGLAPHRINRPTVSKIKREIREGFPVLVSVDDDEHWAVVYGYARQGLFVCDPSIRRAWRCRCSTQEFLRRWDKWAMAVRRR